MKKLLLSWPLREQRRFFEEGIGIPLKVEDESGKLFPVSDRARDVRDGLVDRARHAGVRFRFETSVEDLTPPTSPTEGWRIALSDGETIEAGSVILATGGLSVPATGSDGTGLRILKRLGHTLHDLYPALTPLLANPAIHAELAGVSLEATLVAPRGGSLRAEGGRSRAENTGPIPVGGKNEDKGGFLFTHRGYSGPVVLNLSHHAVLARMWREPQPLLARWTGEGPEVWDERLRTKSSGGVGGLLRAELPGRLADRLMREAEVDPATPLARLPKERRRALANLLGGYPLPWTGDVGYK
jgi:predicted Rossmann fold flavoprotein